MSRIRYIFSIILVSVSVIALCNFNGALGTEEAYVTLLYGDEFLLGVRVLGKSIRDTGSTKDMVVLVSDGVSDYAKKLIQADGWIVNTISLLENPNQVRPTRFWGVYTKLKIFNMTTYKKVVYLDADTIVVKDIEDVFKCQKFCANLKHSERLNSGVLVVEPSEDLFKDMMTKVNTMYSYTGGDQGFLNSYFPDFANARVFDPHASPEELISRPSLEMERLSTLYNADVGLYMLANKWMVDEEELRVIHYTLGPLKPWDWWTHWLVKPVDVWQNIRINLEERLPGTGGGQNPNDELLVKFLILIPFVFLAFCYYRSYLQIRSLIDHIRHLYYKLRFGGVLGYFSVISPAMSTNQQIADAAHCKVPIYLGIVSVFVCFVAAIISIILSFTIVPRQIMPWTGFLLFYEWTFTIFFILFGSYLRLIHLWGKYVANQATSFSTLDYASGKGHLRQMCCCDVGAWYYGLGMTFISLAVPLLPCALGITVLFLRKDPNEFLQVEKEFRIPNIENIVEEGKKKPTKFRKITLCKPKGVGHMDTIKYTASGWPSVSGDTLRHLVGKVSADFDFFDDVIDEELPENENVKASDGSEAIPSESPDTSSYGAAYSAYDGGQTGIEACHAIAALCEVCSIDSLLSNFILPLQGDHISGKNGRIHCSLNINTETGRLSARRPNLQNQPALEKDRYKIRQAFIAAPGNSLIVADYGQLELRILAHLANCESMLNAFKAGGDFHSRTAMNMYPHICEAVERKDVLLEWYPQPGEDKPPAPLLKDAFASERRKAKMLNFSIAYGKTSVGLANDWKVTRKEAQETVDLWYSDRKEVLAWQEERKKEARISRCVHTLLGRARHFPSLHNATKAHKNHIERAAINTPVQGSAADVAMCAMLEISKNARLKELGWRLLLQVHDEMILEGPDESCEEAKNIVVDCMSKPFNGENFLRVALSVDAKFAKNWYSAK